MFLQTL